MCTYTWNTDKPCWQYAGDGRHHCKLDGDHANEDHVCWCDETSNAYCVIEHTYDDFGAIPYVCDYTWSTGEAGETYQCTLIHDPREKNVLHYDEIAGRHEPAQLRGAYHALKINEYLPLSGVMFDDNPPLASAFPWFEWDRSYELPPLPKLTIRQRIARSKLSILWNLRIVDVRDYHHNDDCDW